MDANTNPPLVSILARATLYLQTHGSADCKWESDKWGNFMIEACFTSAKMAALGMDLEETTFSDAMKGGNHLLAPTGSDLEKFDVGTPFAGFHYDLNFLTIHLKYTPDLLQRKL